MAASAVPRPAAVQAYAARVGTIRQGTTWDRWRAEHGEPLAVTGTLAVWKDGSVTVDVGAGALRPLGDLIADYFEVRADATGDRLVGRVTITVDLKATPEPPAGWV